MREHFRGVVWPSGEVAPKRYLYKIAGVIITDQPIDVGHSTGYLDGDTHQLDLVSLEVTGLLHRLEKLQVYEPPYVLGDATSIFFAMDNFNPEKDVKMSHEACDSKTLKVGTT